MAVATAPPICMSPLRLVVDVHSAVHRVTHSPPFCPSVLSLNCLCFLVTLSRCCLVVYACGGRPGAMGQAPSGRSYLNPLAWFERRDDRERRWRIRTAPKPVRVAAVVALFLVLVLSSLVWFFFGHSVVLSPSVSLPVCVCVCVSVCLSVCAPAANMGRPEKKKTHKSQSLHVVVVAMLCQGVFAARVFVLVLPSPTRPPRFSWYHTSPATC